MTSQQVKFIARLMEHKYLRLKVKLSYILALISNKQANFFFKKLLFTCPRSFLTWNTFHKCIEYTLYDNHFEHILKMQSLLVLSTNLFYKCKMACNAFTTDYAVWVKCSVIHFSTLASKGELHVAKISMECSQQSNRCAIECNKQNNTKFFNIAKMHYFLSVKSIFGFTVS